MLQIMIAKLREFINEGTLTEIVEVCENNIPEVVNDSRFLFIKNINESGLHKSTFLVDRTIIKFYTFLIYYLKLCKKYSGKCEKDLNHFIKLFNRFEYEIYDDVILEFEGSRHIIHYGGKEIKTNFLFDDFEYYSLRVPIIVLLDVGRTKYFTLKFL